MQSAKLKAQNDSVNLKTEVKYRAYIFSLTIIKLTATFPEKRVYWILSDQLIRSATSIGANIVEAKSSSSKREFVKFFEIALKSANETKYWLCLLRDSKLVIKETIDPILQETTEIANILGSSLITLKGKR